MIHETDNQTSGNSYQRLARQGASLLISSAYMMVCHWLVDKIEGNNHMNHMNMNHSESSNFAVDYLKMVGMMAVSMIAANQTVKLAENMIAPCARVALTSVRNIGERRFDHLPA